MPINQVEIVRAEPEEAGALSELAMASKAHWGYPAHWMEMWRLSLTVEPETIRSEEVFVVRGPDGPQGFYALIGRPPRLVLDQLWVRPGSISKGLGRALVEHALARAAEIGAEEIEVQAEPHAEKFYLHMGAKRIGEYIYDLEGQRRVLPRLVFVLERGTSS